MHSIQMRSSCTASTPFSISTSFPRGGHPQIEQNAVHAGGVHFRGTFVPLWECGAQTPLNMSPDKHSPQFRESFATNRSSKRHSEVIICGMAGAAR